MDIILASASPRRQELLHLIFEDFRCIPADIEEIVPDGMEATCVPEYLACQKALHVSKQYPDSLVIGSDTAVICEDEIFGKPVDDADAERMIRALSGKAHYVITGCCIFCNGKSLSFSEKTVVEFYALTDDEIKAYVATGEPKDKAGAYGIQGEGSLLVKGINGDFFNVVGLPVSRLNRELKKFTV